MALISAIVAYDRNRCIGRGNDLPWHIPSDLKRTKELTMGKPLIMGRKTYDSIAARRNGKPLPGRDSIVISRSMTPTEFENVFVVASLEQALAQATKRADVLGAEEIVIFGGAQIYEQALTDTQRIYATEVALDVEGGDAFFPSLQADAWQERAREDHTQEDGPAFSYVTYERTPFGSV